MSRKQIITTDREREKARLFDYSFPPGEGSFTGTLTHRSWHPVKQCLLCYFDTDTGEHFKLAVWWDKEYKPKKSDVCFADDVTNGNRWKCGFVKAQKGSTTWMTAEQIK